MRNLNSVTGALICALLAAGCSNEHGKELAKTIEQQKSVKFSAAQFGCVNPETLTQAESLQQNGQHDRFQALIQQGKCEWLPTNAGLTVTDMGKEDEDSVVIGVIKDASKLSVVLFTRYRYQG